MVSNFLYFPFLSVDGLLLVNMCYTNISCIETKSILDHEISAFNFLFVDLKICFITLYITTLSIDTLMQRNRCSSWCSPQWNVRRFEMKLAVLSILFVSWWYRCLKCLPIIQKKKENDLIVCQPNQARNIF